MSNQSNFHHLALSQTHQKQYQLRNMLRSRYIDDYRQRIRKENASRYIIDRLTSQIPTQFQEIQQWCKKILHQFQQTKKYFIHDSYIYELFDLIKKHPNSLTLNLFRCLTHKISVSAVHIMFQCCDIMKFLHNVLVDPEIVTQFDENDTRIQVVKNVLLIIAQFCQISLKTRNFMVMSQKTYDYVQRTHKNYEEQIKAEYILCLQKFTKYPMQNHEQFLKITSTVIQIYASSDKLNTLLPISKCLLNLFRTKEEGIVEILIRQKDRLLHKTQQLLASIQFFSLDQGSGQFYHNVNLVIINYAKFTKDFDWLSFMGSWIRVLSYDQCEFSEARRDVFYILGNIIRQSFYNDYFYYLTCQLVEKYNLAQILGQRLQRQMDSDAIYELCFVINQFLKLQRLIDLSSWVKEIIPTILQFIATFSGFAANESKECLLEGLRTFIREIEDKNEKQKWAQIYVNLNSYRERLLNLSSSCTSSRIMDQLIDCLYGEE